MWWARAQPGRLRYAIRSIAGKVAPQGLRGVFGSGWRLEVPGCARGLRPVLDRTLVGKPVPCSFAWRYALWISARPGSECCAPAERILAVPGAISTMLR